MTTTENPCADTAFIGYAENSGETCWRVCAYCPGKSAVEKEGERLCVRVTHSICDRHLQEELALIP